MTTLLADLDSLCYKVGSLPSSNLSCRKAYELLEEIKAAVPHDRFEGFIEHPVVRCSFRKFVACSKPYKGNREGRERPPWVPIVKEYLHLQCSCRYCYYIESDDAVCIRAHELGLDNVVIAGIDKDLYQIPTKFYDYSTKQHFQINEALASVNLWKQVLTGDSGDNVPGLPGIGPKTAEDILSAVVDGNYCEVVARAYSGHSMPYQYFLEQSRLVYLLKKVGDVWTPCTKEQYDNWSTTT